MHIYVNGQEQAVTVAAGTTNPTGPIQNPTDIYIGHDSMTEIDQLQISNTDQLNRTAAMDAMVALDRNNFCRHSRKRFGTLFKKTEPNAII